MTPTITQSPALRVVSTCTALPDRIVLHAPAGWGKTSLLAYFPAPLFATIRGEDGLQSLIAHGQLPPTAHFPTTFRTWDALTDAIRQTIDSEHPYQTFVIDVANGAERLAHELVCDQEFSGEWGDHNDKGFNAYGAGERVTTNKLWKPFLNLLDELREIRMMRIVLLCHTVIREYTNPAGADYKRIEPALSRSAWRVTQGWADMILSGDYETWVGKSKGGRSPKATGGERRILRCQPHAVYDAKNRHGLPHEISLGDSPAKAWADFRAAFPRTTKQTSHVANGAS